MAEDSTLLIVSWNVNINGSSIAVRLEMSHKCPALNADLDRLGPPQGTGASLLKDDCDFNLIKIGLHLVSLS